MSNPLELPAKTNLWLLPNIVWVAISVMLGILLCDQVDIPTNCGFAVFFAWIIAAILLCRTTSKLLLFACVCASCLSLGIIRGNSRSDVANALSLREFCQDGAVTLSVDGTITSIPIVHRKWESVFSPRMYGSPHQTRFEVEVDAVSVNGQRTPVSGVCRVYLEGRAADLLGSGDAVTVEGRLDWPRPPGNPGEFNFEAYLLRHDVSGMFFVDSVNDINIVRASSGLAPSRILGRVRAEVYRILAMNVKPEVRGIAMALLLGSRHELPPEIKRSFVASGTMHLLAISGLHVGILCLFLLRVQHILMVRRRLALLVTLCVCLTYAFLTDLRPSVVRATIFFLVFVVGELVHRNQRMPGLLSLTALIMMMLSPGIVFQIGAWLSFLSVAALGWEASRRKVDSDDRETPLDALTPGEHLKHLGFFCARWLEFRYRQMLYILLFTTPLIASTFHVLSPVGLFLNIALIPLTAFALCIGFFTVGMGLLYPSAASLTGWLFSGCLKLLATTVSATASTGFGYFYIADFPAWFLPTYYTILTAGLLLRSLGWRRICFSLLIIVWTCVLSTLSKPPHSIGLVCTVLDVGDGNATVIECESGDVYLVDAGAKNRSERTADIVCEFLWSRGHQKLTGIFASHPDPDHINGIPGILARIPVAEIVVSDDFVESEDLAVKALQDLIEAHQIPLRSIKSGASMQVAKTTLTLHQIESAGGGNFDDDEKSLVMEVAQGSTRVFITGDLEGQTDRSLLPRLGACTVLVAPGHGSKKANSAFVAEALRPDFVVVSSSDTANRTYLENIYAASRAVLFTSEAGAVSVRADAKKAAVVTTYR